jgi:uncharacterized membrane protein
MIQSTMKAISTGTSRTRLTTAPLLKFCCPITCLKMSTASTLKLPPITLGMPKSLTVYENTTIVALTKPNLAPGSVMVRNRRNIGVRSDSAAS